MTTVETRVVHSVNRAPVDPVNVDERDIEAAIKREEDDEEISSTEGLELESQMLTVALVKSVVDATPNGGKKESDSSSPRYGLRKRRRPGDTASGMETDQIPVSSEVPATKAKVLAKAHTLPATATVKSEVMAVKSEPIRQPLQPQLKTIPPPHLSKNAVIKKEVPTPLTIKEDPHATKGTNIKDHPILGKLQSTVALAPGNVARPTLVKPAKPVPAKAKKKPAPPRRKAKRPAKTKGPAVKQQIVPTPGAVPNPLSQATVPAPALPQPYASARKPAETSSVPCPLPTSVPCPLQPDSMVAPAPVAAAAPIVPVAPVPPVAPVEKKKVTISEPPVSTVRPRIFSVDLDPSTFDFTDMTGDSVNDRPEHGPVDVPVGDSSDLTIFQRDRAFSFDFFNFTGDELLPAATTSGEIPPPAGAPLPHPGAPSVFDESSALPRPRGDSIIFDPASFQDGGIHEKNALIKGRGSIEPVPEPPVTSNPGLVPPTNAVPAESRHPNNTTSANIPPVPPYNGAARDGATGSGQIATLPSSLSNNSPSSVSSSPATFQMELLNKDGRIGIYLPEARKARIARFHAKRKMRIWRKRIKYDCRKKLADSRPRIKGRFVKRSDMEDD